MIQDLLVYLVFMGYSIGVMLGVAPLFTWVERNFVIIILGLSALKF